MAEGLLMQVGPSVYTHRSAHQSESSVQTHLGGGAGLQQECGANQRSAYCKELLMRGGTEFSFEELRAERYNKQQSFQLDEKLRCLKELKEQLSVELEEKKKLLLLRKSQQQVVPEGSASQIRGCGPAVSPFQIYDESQSAAAQPAGDKLQDDVFLRPDESALCLKIQYPQPGAAGVSEHDQTEPHDSSAAQNNFQFNKSPTGHQKGETIDLLTEAETRRPEPVSKTRKKLSPIQETSVETNSLTSLGGCSLLQEHQEEEEQEVEVNRTPSPAGGAIDACDPDVRQRLLDLCDVTSCLDLHSEPHPLPTVEEHSWLQLGGVVHHIYSRVVDGGSFSIYKGATEDDSVFIKVDSCSIPWDFHQFQRLKRSSSTAGSLPLISCFLFLDGCITIYTARTDHMFSLTECAPTELLVGRKSVALLQLVSQLHSCGLLHAALQPNILACSHRCVLSPDCVFPLDWSSSVDLNLQQDVTSVQQVLSAQKYINVGLLEPDAPPQLVDLVGVAETVHLLLTNSRMVSIKDAGGWTAEQFSGDEPCDMYSRMWRRFFRSLLNPGVGSSSSVLLELEEQLSALYH
uniref:uncharacterized protein bub1ba n=1 Tax=Scatophagus argus TaxID=75038 RepID=UPI001ED7FADE|nr:uncharacterized protein bub1ba [Scatophagus argus]